MATKTNTGETIYHLDTPMREGKEGFIGMLFGQFLKGATLLTSDGFSITDTRIEIYTHFLISMVPGEKKREAIREAMVKEVEEKLELAKKNRASNEELGRIRLLTCIKHIGKVTDYTDLHVGVSIENRLGFVAAKQ